jgi:hypothetical protein
MLSLSLSSFAISPRDEMTDSPPRLQAVHSALEAYGEVSEGGADVDAKAAALQALVQAVDGCFERYDHLVDHACSSHQTTRTLTCCDAAVRPAMEGESAEEARFALGQEVVDALVGCSGENTAWVRQDGAAQELRSAFPTESASLHLPVLGRC